MICQPEVVLLFWVTICPNFRLVVLNPLVLLGGVLLYLQEAQHSQFTMYVLHYICGYIVSKLAKTICCFQCINKITTLPNQSQEKSDHDYCGRTSTDDMYDKAAAFTNFVNRGGAHVSSEFTVEIVSYADKAFRCNVPKSTSNNIPYQKKVKQKMVKEGSHHFADKVPMRNEKSHNSSINETH